MHKRFVLLIKWLMGYKLNFVNFDSLILCVIIIIIFYPEFFFWQKKKSDPAKWIEWPRNFYTFFFRYIHGRRFTLNATFISSLIRSSVLLYIRLETLLVPFLFLTFVNCFIEFFHLFYYKLSNLFIKNYCANYRFNKIFSLIKF